jgi:hypothetical protein
MPDSSLSVKWHDRQAVVVLPEHVDLANAGQLRDQLLVLINRGAAVVILDMTRACRLQRPCLKMARDRIKAALARLDDTIHEIRGYEFDELGDDSVT